MAASMDLSEIRGRLSGYTPGSTRNLTGHGYGQVCLQLFGMAGHGKSSLINSSLCVVKDLDYNNVAGSGQSDTPLTMEWKGHQLLKNVSITDNRGIIKLSEEEVLEITAQLAYLQRKGEVRWESNLDRITEVLLEKIRQPPTEITVPVFVYRYQNHHFAQHNTRHMCSGHVRKKGIFPIIVLTKYENFWNTTRVWRKFKDLGATKIFRLENYTSENPVRSTDKDRDILQFVDTCLQEADRGIAMKRGQDPQLQFLKKATEIIRNITKMEIEKRDAEIKVLEDKVQSTSDAFLREMMEKLCLEKELQRITRK
ncbi:uncharacterized protein RCH25_036039 [Pelodytes ibericus]